MNQKEARGLLKELLAKCELGADSFVIVEPDPNDKLSTGYKIRVKTSVDPHCRDQLRTITKKHDMAVVEEQSQIVVYKPKSKYGVV